MVDLAGRSFLKGLFGRFSFQQSLERLAKMGTNIMCSSSVLGVNTAGSCRGEKKQCALLEPIMINQVPWRATVVVIKALTLIPRVSKRFHVLPCCHASLCLDLFTLPWKESCASIVHSIQRQFKQTSCTQVWTVRNAEVHQQECRKQHR